jgi:hypothetical protein
MIAGLLSTAQPEFRAPSKGLHGPGTIALALSGRKTHTLSLALSHLSLSDDTRPLKQPPIIISSHPGHPTSRLEEGRGPIGVVFRLESFVPHPDNSVCLTLDQPAARLGAGFMRRREPCEVRGAKGICLQTRAPVPRSICHRVPLLPTRSVLQSR